jgi:hypothetical protein
MAPLTDDVTSHRCLATAHCYSQGSAPDVWLQEALISILVYATSRLAQAATLLT